MKATELYAYLTSTIGTSLIPSDIDKGRAFFWKEKRLGAKSTRVLRVHENAAGTITEIKLPVTSLRTRVVTTLPLPASFEEVITAVRKEIDLLD